MHTLFVYLIEIIKFDKYLHLKLNTFINYKYIKICISIHNYKFDYNLSNEMNLNSNESQFNSNEINKIKIKLNKLNSNDINTI